VFLFSKYNIKTIKKQILKSINFTFLKQSQKQIKTQYQIKKPNSAFPTQKSEHNIDGKSCKTSKTG
jgi:hypothetical protein